MMGREQPYLGANGTGAYVPTQWRDDVPGMQEGTPVDEQNLGNMEAGINGANIFAEFLAEVAKHQGDQINNVSGEVIEATLTNASGEAFFNNSAQTLTLAVSRDTLDYTVTAEVTKPIDNVGDIVIYDKQLNGFKVKHTGSARSVPLKLYVKGGNAA